MRRWYVLKRKKKTCSQKINFLSFFVLINIFACCHFFLLCLCFTNLFFSVDLFHSGVGETRETRFVAISIYRDGLSHVPGIGKYVPTLPFLNYKPWALREEVVSRDETNATVMTTPQAVTKKAKEAIYQFIDQPGDSLRDDIDELDFEQLENDDLSDLEAPKFDEKDWLLVDTVEKMKQCVREIQVRIDVGVAGRCCI